METFEAGKYHEAFVALLNYIDADIVSKFSNADRTEFTVPHGSALVNMKIENGILKVDAPFLKLPEKASVALLRQVAQINFWPLTISQIVLEGDQLIFRWQAPLSLCEPYKTYYVLREICQNADQYDDEFIKKFGAQRLREPKVTRYEKAKADEMWSLLQKFASEAFEYIKYFTDKRWDGFVWDSIVHALYKIEFVLGPQGFFRNELERTVNLMWNKDIPLIEVNAKGKKYLETVLAYKREDFDNDIYMIDNFVPYKSYLSAEQIKSNLQETINTAQGELNSNNYIGATYTLFLAFLKNFYNHNIPAEQSNILRNGLVESSGRAWADSATILMNAAKAVAGGGQASSTSTSTNTNTGWGS
jgi:hypothetical protein